MHRRGWIYSRQATDNQCKAPGHDKYHYHVILACSETLDEDDFIIDHNTVNQYIQRIKVRGSCEQIHKAIYRAVRKAFAQTVTNLYLYKCILSPSLPNGEAYMEYIKLPPLPPGVKRPSTIRNISWACTKKQQSVFSTYYSGSLVSAASLWLSVSSVCFSQYFKTKNNDTHRHPHYRYRFLPFNFGLSQCSQQTSKAN